MNQIICISAFVLFPLLLLAIAIFICIPQMLATYEKLKQSNKAADFSLMLFLGTISFGFLAFAYLSCIQYYQLLFRSQSQIIKILTPIILLLLVFYLFIPQAYQLFHHWRKNKKPMDFAQMIFLCWLTLCSLTLVFFRLFLILFGSS